MPADRVPRLTTPARRSWVVVAASLGLIAAGLLRIDGELASIGGAGLLLLGVAWIAGRMNLARLALEIDGPKRVFAGATFPLRLTLRNRRRCFDAFAVQASLGLPGGARPGGFARWTPAGSAADLSLRTSIPARGRGETHHFTLSSTFPLGLFRFASHGHLTAPMLVFPRPLTPIELLAAGVLLESAPLDGSSPGDAPGEPRGLRSYRSGDPPKRIHWGATVRTLARGAGPVVRENDPPGFHPQHASVLFHSFGSDRELIRPDCFERALSLAAGTLRHLHSLGIPATFIADFHHWHDLATTTRKQLADCLEVIADAHRAPGTETHDLQTALSRIPPTHTLVILSDMPADTWQRHLPPRSLAPLLIDIRRHASRGRRRLLTATPRQT